MTIDHDHAERFMHLGLRQGKCVFICGELKGADESPTNLANAIVQTIGPSGTLVAPSNCPLILGLEDFISSQPGSTASAHPAFAFAAIGANAEFIAANAPLHFPFGSNSPISRLHQLDGLMMIFGPNYVGNPVIHLAEVWADVPYAGLSSIVADGEGNALEIHGYPGCGWGFGKIERVLRQARILREAEIFGVLCQAMSIRQLASMAGDMLKGDPGCLLCDRPTCSFCVHASNLTRKQGEPASERMVQIEDLI